MDTSLKKEAVLELMVIIISLLALLVCQMLSMFWQAAPQRIATFFGGSMSSAMFSGLLAGVLWEFIGKEKSLRSNVIGVVSLLAVLAYTVFVIYSFSPPSLAGTGPWVEIVRIVIVCANGAAAFRLMRIWIKKARSSPGA